jgi:hypothetical protein
MEITGKLIQVLPIQSGEGKNGSVWKKQDIILELDAGKKLCVGLWNDKIVSDLFEGTMLRVSVEIDSREYNNKWYTNLRAWKLEELLSSRENNMISERNKPEETEDFQSFGNANDEDDGLPF